MIALASLLHLSLLLLPHHVIIATSHIVRLSGSDGQKVLESRGAATETHPTGVGSSLSRGSCTGDPAAEERNHTLVEPPYSRPCVTSATHTHTNTHPCTSPSDRSVHGLVGLAHKHRRSPTHRRDSTPQQLWLLFRSFEREHYLAVSVAPFAWSWSTHPRSVAEGVGGQVEGF